MRKILLISATIFLAACGGPPPPTDPPYLSEAKESLSRGNYWYERGCFREAERFFEAGLGSARLSDDVPLIIRANNSLGTAALAGGDLNLAATFLERALELSAATAGQPEMDSIMGNLGSLAFNADEIADAENFWQQAASTAEVLGKSPIIHLCNLARLYLKRERPEFQTLAAKVLAEAQNTPNLTAKADAFNLAGHAALMAGDEAVAENYFQQALELDRKTENSTGLAQDTEALATLYLKQNKARVAVGFYDRAFFLMAASGDYEGQGRVYGILKNLSKTEGFPKKMDVYDKAMRNPEEFSLNAKCP